jgi:hypothetical protein
MRKFLLGAAATAAIVAPLALAPSAEAAPVLNTDANCTPVLPADAIAEVNHTEYKWSPVVTNAGPTQWNLDNPAANTRRDFIVKGATVKYFRDGTKSKVVVDSPAVPPVVGVNCVVAEPQPKVLPVPGIDNDQIYENPSEQFTEHVTGHVTGLWSNGTAQITYTTEAGYAFADGQTMKVVPVTEIDQRVVISIPANPLDVTLTQPADTDKVAWSEITDHSLTTNKVGIVATAKPGYVFAYGGGFLTSKNLTLTNVKQFSYVDVAFGNVTCHEIQTAAFEDVYCAFDAPRSDLAGTSGSYQWTSDYDLNTQGTLNYKVNAEGTGYRGTVTYPAV